jgi:predicted DNA-binding transcriptional regulator YafY
MDRSERFYRIDQLLNERRIVSMKQFLEALEISPATIKRDLEYLRSRFGAPIEWDPKRNGYCYVDPQPGQARFSLPGLWFNADEIQALLLMQDLLVQLQPVLLWQHLGPMRARLEALLAAGGVKISELRRRIRILRTPSRIVEPKHFQTVSSATLSRKRLDLLYYSSSSNEETRRTVSPQRLIYYRSNWYLDAWCHLRKALRSFAVDAIHKAMILSVSTREVSETVLDKHLGAGYGIYAGQARDAAFLRFTPAAARWVAREQWHSKQMKKYDSEGFLTLKVPYSNDQELVMDILRYAGNVEVLKPSSLRQKVETALRAALAQYDTGLPKLQDRPPANHSM